MERLEIESARRPTVHGRTGSSPGGADTGATYKSNEPGMILASGLQHATFEEITHVASEADLVGETPDLVVHEHICRRRQSQLRGVHTVVLHPITEPVALEGLPSQFQDRSAVDGDQSCRARFQREHSQQTTAAPHVDHQVVGPDQVAQCTSVGSRSSPDRTRSHRARTIRHTTRRRSYRDRRPGPVGATDRYSLRWADGAGRRTMMDGSTVLRMPDSVSMRKVHDEVVLLDMSSEQYYGLNAVGACVIEAVNGGADVDGAVSAVIACIRRARR